MKYDVNRLGTLKNSMDTLEESYGKLNFLVKNKKM